MPDHEAGTINAEGARAFAPHYAFGLVLGPEVRMIELLRFVEHVFAEDAVVKAGSGDRAHMMEASGLHARRKLHGVTRAFHISDALRIGRGFEVVNRSEMEN